MVPFVPIGMETLVHNKPKRRGKFAEHCSKGYGLGKYFEHYRSWIMWMKDTRETSILAKVFHKHKYITDMGVTPEDRVISAAVKLAENIKGCMTHYLRNKTLEQLEKIGTILKQVWMHRDHQPPPGNSPLPPPQHTQKVRVVLPKKRIWITCNNQTI